MLPARISNPVVAGTPSVFWRRIHARKRSASAAFTFVELLVVLLVMGIVAAVAAPTFYRSLTHHRLESAARRVKQDLEYLRDAARAKSAPLVCDFDDDTQSYRIDNADTRDLDHDQAYEVELGADPYSMDGVASAFGDPTVHTIEFDGFGVPSTGGTIVLTLAGETRTVAIADDSGEISIQSP